MSLLMVRKSAPAHAADASEVQRVEKLLKRELTDAEFWKLGDYVMKHMKVGKTFTDNELLSAVKDAAVNEFNRLVDSAKDAADVAQDSGDYTTNATALLKMAYENLNKAEGVVTRACTNISAAKSKVKDEQTKSFLNRIEHEWLSCKKEIYEVINELRTIAVPSSYGVPHKEKMPPEDRNILAEFFG